MRGEGAFIEVDAVVGEVGVSSAVVLDDEVEGDEEDEEGGYEADGDGCYVSMMLCGWGCGAVTYKVRCGPGKRDGRNVLKECEGIDVEELAVEAGVGDSDDVLLDGIKICPEVDESRDGEERVAAVQSLGCTVHGDGV